MLKVLLGLAVCLGFCCAHAAADATKLSANVRAALMREKDFTLIKKVDQIPAEAFRALGKPEDFRMANPGEPFQETDVVADESLPWRQLHFAAVSRDYLLLYYLKGGYALDYYLVLLKKTDGKYALVWKATTSRFSDYHQLVQALDSNLIDDRLDSGY